MLSNLGAILGAILGAWMANSVDLGGHFGHQEGFVGGLRGHFRTSFGSCWGFGRGIGQESSVEDVRSGESSLTSTKKQVCLSLPGNLGSSESSLNSAKHVAHKLFGRCSEWRILVDVDEKWLFAHLELLPVILGILVAILTLLMLEVANPR